MMDEHTGLPVYYFPPAYCNNSSKKPSLGD
jgi:hypothetical protein